MVIKINKFNCLRLGGGGGGVGTQGHPFVEFRDVHQVPHLRIKYSDIGWGVFIFRLIISRGGAGGIRFIYIGMSTGSSTSI